MDSPGRTFSPPTPAHALRAASPKTSPSLGAIFSTTLTKLSGSVLDENVIKMSTLRVQLNKLSSDWQVARALLEDEYTSLHKTLNKFQNRYEFAQHLLDVHRNWCVRRTIAWSSRCLPERSDGQNDRDAAEFGSRIYVSASTQTGVHDDDDESSQEKDEDEDHREEESVDGWIDLQDDMSATHHYSTADLQSNFESSNPVSDLHAKQEVVAEQLYDVHVESSRKESTSEQRPEDEIPTPHSASDVQFGVESTNHVSDLLIKEEVVSYENDDVHMQSSLNESTNQLTHEERIPTLRIRSDVESHLERIDSFSDIFIKQEPEENYDVDVEMDMNASTSHQGPAEWIPTQHIASDGNSVDIYNEPSTSTLHRDIDSPELSSQDIVDTDGRDILDTIVGLPRTTYHSDKDSPDGSALGQCDAAISSNKTNIQAPGTHTREKPNLSSRCEKDSITKTPVAAHLRTHSGQKPYQCSVCNKVFPCSSVLTVHMRTHTGEKPFKCSFCSYRCSTKGNLSIHMKIHTDEKPFECTFCRYKCSRKSQLTRHMKIHTGEKPFQCDSCTYRCSLKNSLRRHMKTHTEEKSYECSVCNEVLTSRNLYKNHMRAHTGGDKPFGCDCCPYRCSSKSNLTIHMKVHSEEKPYECNFCHYKCSRKSQLTRHTRRHTGEKPFECESCSYRCSLKSSLTDHMRRHTEERFYQCSVCNTFLNSKHLHTIHMRTHTGD